MTRFGDIDDLFGSGGKNLAPGQGITNLRDALRALLGTTGQPYADAAALTASKAADRVDGQTVLKIDDYSFWTWEAAATDAAGTNVVVPTDVGSGAGRWVNRALIASVQSGAVHTPVADVTALANVPAAERAAGMVCLVQSNHSLWVFHATSTAADTTNNLVVTPAAGSGRWLRLNRYVTLSLPVAFGNADASVLFTTPTGAKIHPRDAWWEITTNWTGGSSSAIGVSSSVAGFNTKGDVLGGAGGDVAATLVTTNTRMTGTVGTQLDTRAHGRLLLIAGDTLKFDRITSAFTAGAGNVRVTCDVVANPGA